MVFCKCFNVASWVLISFVCILPEKSVEAGVVYYIKPSANLIPPRPYLGYSVIPISPVASLPPLKYVDYKWVNVKNTGVFAVPGVPASALTLFKYSPPFPPITPFRVPPIVSVNPLSLPVPLSVVPIPYRRLQFIRLRRNSEDLQPSPEKEEPEKMEETTTRNKSSSITERPPSPETETEA